LDTTFKPTAINTKVNVARTYKSRKVDKVFRMIKSLIHQYTNANIVSAIKKLNIHKLIEEHNTKEQDAIIIPPMSQSTRNKLRSIFFDEIKELEKIIDRDLSDWYQPDLSTSHDNN
jgi:hypothetical protein